jgi:hypothetical protein
MTAAFLGSLVEFVEALTIVLAVGTVRGWRPALIGAGGGVVALAGLIALAGPSLGSMPITWLQFGVGVLLVLFGMRWLRKAVLRAGGVVALHDELVFSFFDPPPAIWAGASGAYGHGLRDLAEFSRDPCRRTARSPQRRNPG